MKQITEKRKLGDLGEDIACRFLVKHGFNIIERNYLKKCGEIDIIAKKSDILHFIEVKSVSGEINLDQTKENCESNKYRPEDNIHSWKLQRITKTIQLYLIEREVSPETDWEFDVVTVIIDKKQRISRVKILNNVIL